MSDPGSTTVIAFGDVQSAQASYAANLSARDGPVGRPSARWLATSATRATTVDLDVSSLARSSRSSLIDIASSEPATCDRAIIYTSRANPYFMSSLDSSAASSDASVGPGSTEAVGRIIEIMINAMPVEARALLDNPLLDPDTPGERPQITQFYLALN